MNYSKLTLCGVSVCIGACVCGVLRFMSKLYVEAVNDLNETADDLIKSYEDEIKSLRSERDWNFGVTKDTLEENAKLWKENKRLKAKLNSRNNNDEPTEGNEELNTCYETLEEKLHTSTMKELIKNYMDAFITCCVDNISDSEYYQYFALMIVDEAEALVTSRDDQKLYDAIKEYQLTKVKLFEHDCDNYSFERKSNQLVSIAEDITNLIINKYFSKENEESRYFFC